jgi:hypothetical protein
VRVHPVTVAKSHPWSVVTIVLGAALASVPAWTSLSLLPLLIGGAVIAAAGFARYCFFLGRQPATREVPPASLWKRFKRRVGTVTQHIDDATPSPMEPSVDPLTNRYAAVLVTAVLLGVVVASLLVAFSQARPRSLPGVALGSLAILHIEQAAVVALAVTILVVFLFRAAFGYFPSKVSTSGAEWTSGAATAIALSNKVASGTEETISVLNSVTDDQFELDERLRDQREALRAIGLTTNRQGDRLAALTNAFIKHVPAAAEDLLAGQETPPEAEPK